MSVRRGKPTHRCHARRSVRGIAYGDYGATAGLPVVFLHGSPGSRLEAAAHDVLARRLDLRLIAPEREGMGRSEPTPGQTLTQDACDVLALLDELKIHRFAVIGYSGGAGCLYALRHLAPERVLCAVDVAGFAPVGDHAELRSHLALLDRLYLTVGRRLPAVFRLAFVPLVHAARHADPQRLARFMRSSLSPADTAWLSVRDNLLSLHADVSEACRQGVDGPARDALRLYRRWGFALDDRPSTLLIYAGGQDRFAPDEFARWKATRMPSSRCRIFEGVGHLGIVDHMPEILQALAFSARRGVSLHLDTSRIARRPRPASGDRDTLCALDHQTSGHRGKGSHGSL